MLREDYNSNCTVSSVKSPYATYLLTDFIASALK